MSDAETLLDELATHVAAALSLHYATVPDGENRQLYTHRLARPEADEVASVLRNTGGPGDGYGPLRSLTVQCLTQAPTEAAAMARAWRIFGVFLDADNLPVRNLDLTTWRILTIDALQKPAGLGPLDGGGADVSFNWIIKAAAIPAP